MASVSLMAEDLDVLVCSVIQVHGEPGRARGWGGEELITFKMAEDKHILVFKDMVFFWPSVLGVAGGPSSVGLRTGREKWQARHA